MGKNNLQSSELLKLQKNYTHLLAEIGHTEAEIEQALAEVGTEARKIANSSKQ